MAVDEAAARTQLAQEAGRFASLGWMRGTSGNVSVVLSRDPLRLAVTASGVDKGELTGDDAVIVDERGLLIGNGSTKPSAEAALHARIAARTGADAVVHVHHLGSVVAAARHPEGLELEGLEMLKGIGREAEGDVVRVPVIANSQDMTELGDRFEAAYLDATPAVVVAAHGLYAWGRDLRQARHHTEIVAWLLDYLTEVSR